MILHNERDLAILEAGLVMTGGSFLAVLLGVFVFIMLLKRKYQRRRNLVISLLGSTLLLFPLVYTLCQVREFYEAVVDRSPGLILIVIAYGSVLAFTVVGPIVQHWLRVVPTVPEHIESPT